MIDVNRDFTRMQDYLSGRLPESDRRTFEDRMLRDPALVRELEITLQLREGLERLRAAGELDMPAARSRARWRPALALAAAALACVAVFLGVRPMSGHAPESLLVAADSAAAGGELRPLAAHFAFIATRGGRPPDLDLPTSGLIELRAMPARHATNSTYRMTLDVRRTGGSWSTVGLMNGVSRGADGFVHGYAEASTLRPGDYELRLDTGGGTDTAVDSFAFHLHAHARPSD